MKNVEKCHKQGHFERVCKQKFVNKIGGKSEDIENEIENYDFLLSAVNKSTNSNSRASIRAIINELTCLMDFD